MALAERAELVARLSLKDDFSGRLGAVERNFKGSMGKISTAARKGVTSAATNIAKIGAIAAVGVTAALKSGIDSLVQLEDATTSVDGAIKQMGLTGQVTSGQIAGWANEIETSVQAAFDDKEITQSATTLLRYGKLAPKNLKPALTVMTDLAAKTGDVDSAASLLAKALADPSKAAGKLAKNGVILTKVEQDQIDAFVKAGKVGKAQEVILASLAKTTAGAAAAMRGPYADAQNILRDTWEDTTRVLAEGALPVLIEVQQLLTKELAKPGTLAKVREFGKGIAGGVKGLVDIAKNIPWAQVGTTFEMMGKGAKAALDLFTSMPPWVQTAVLTGWGLNKLTGGALGTIFGELGKGLIKGVLGMNAGVVNIKAGVVNGAGGGAGGAAAAAGGGALALTAAALAPGIVAAVTGILADQANKDPGRTALGVTGEIKGTTGLDINAINNLGVLWTEAIPKMLEAVNNPKQPLPLDPRNLSEGNKEVVDAVATSKDKIESMRIALSTKLGATQTAINNSRTATINNTAVTRTGDAAIVAAIKANRPVINLGVNVSSTSVVRVYQTGATMNRVGSGSGPGGPLDPRLL